MNSVSATPAGRGEAGRTIFDRLLICQTIRPGLTIRAADRAIEATQARRTFSWYLRWLDSQVLPAPIAGKGKTLGDLVSPLVPELSNVLMEPWRGNEGHGVCFMPLPTLPTTAMEIRKPPFGGFLDRSWISLRKLRFIRATLAFLRLPELTALARGILSQQRTLPSGQFLGSCVRICGRGASPVDRTFLAWRCSAQLNYGAIGSTEERGQKNGI